MSNMVVNTNVLALNSHRNMKRVGASQAQASARLSSGQRINSAADDAAGLAISEKMRSQIRGLDMASKNTQDAISLVQTAEGGMQEIGNMTQRIRELVVQASNDTNDQATGDRTKIQGEINQLLEEIDSMAGRVEFNAKKLIEGSYSGATAKASAIVGKYVSMNVSGTKASVTFTMSASVAAASAKAPLSFQVGANANQKIELNINSMNAKDLRLDKLKGSTLDIASGSKISSYLEVVDKAISLIGNERAKLGAVQNRLEYTMKSLDISSENLSASESRIRDTDMAKEMMNFTKTNVLQQAATSMLSQANQAPQNVLQLLR